MAFDIYQKVFDRDGLPLEKMAGPYLDQLMELTDTFSHEHLNDEYATLCSTRDSRGSVP